MSNSNFKCAVAGNMIGYEVDLGFEFDRFDEDEWNNYYTINNLEVLQKLINDNWSLKIMYTRLESGHIAPYTFDFTFVDGVFRIIDNDEPGLLSLEVASYSNVGHIMCVIDEYEYNKGTLVVRNATFTCAESDLTIVKCHATPFM